MRPNVLALGALLLLGCCCLWAAADIGDPYRILGIGKKSTLPEIRKAYKRLAKEWHPDKTDQPNAEEKFVEIKQAYELLADNDRRKAYDLHGITNEDASMLRGQHDYSRYGRHASDPFEEFFGHRFPFDQDISLFHKLSITTKYYDTYVVPQSATQLYVLMFYADWCFSCMKTAPVFKKMIDTLEPLGVTFATVNAGHEDQLLRRASVHSLPCLVLVLDGKNYVYKESLYSVTKMVDFIRHKLPYKLIRPIGDDNADAFLAGWSDNRVRGLVMEPRPQPRLRYLLTAFRFRHRVAFGFVQLNTAATVQIVERYKVHPSLDTVLLFNEDAQRPVASVSMADIPTTTLNNVVATNQYLALPRLSSQALLEGICPTEWNRPRKRLCVILVTANTDTHDSARRALRRIALESAFSAERVRFAYIYQEKQMEFISALHPKSGTADGLTDAAAADDAMLRLVIIWRRDASHVKYEWVSDVSMHWSQAEETLEEVVSETADGNGDAAAEPTTTTTTSTASAMPDDDAAGRNKTGGSGGGSSSSSSERAARFAYNATKEKLDSNIQRLLRSSEALSYEAHVKDLLDEHAIGMLAYIVHRVLLTFEYFSDHIGQEHILPVLSTLGSIAFVVCVGYLMAYLVRVEEEKVQKNGANNNESKPGAYVPELRLHELRAEKYFGLVRMLKPGFRTIVLLTDLQSRQKLIPGYHKALWPYRKNKTLLFSHMLIEKGQNWYAELLRLSMPDASDLQINPRNCIGTVLALNGHRKYFCMYHAKHPESVRGEKRLLKMTRHLSASPADPEAGAFLGMDSDTDEDATASEFGSETTDASILLEENLLDGLSNWLDRLFEGSTHRYYINYWPDFTTK